VAAGVHATNMRPVRWALQQCGWEHRGRAEGAIMYHPFLAKEVTLWLCQNSYGKSPFLMGKSTISMAIFHSYVKLPEGT